MPMCSHARASTASVIACDLVFFPSFFPAWSPAARTVFCYNERERERQTDRQTDRDGERQTDRDRESR